MGHFLWHLSVHGIFRGFRGTFYRDCLLRGVSQIGEGSGMAAKRRELQRQEEQVMASQEESERIARTTGQEIVGRGMFWRG